jgi:hypothetical protein
MAPLALTAVTLLLSAAPAGPAVSLSHIDAQEAVNDSLEVYFDGLCRALKGGRRDLQREGVAAQVQLPVGAFVQLTACSMRALELGEADPKGERRARLYFELDGRTHTGARRSARGEGQALLVRTGQRWSLRSLEPSARAVERQSPRFVERTAAAGLTLPARHDEPTEAEFQAAGLSVRDLDGDGISDVIALDGPNAWLLRGKPGLTFGPPERLGQAPRDSLFTSAALGDVDGDGDADLALTLHQAGPVRLLRNDGAGHFTPWQLLGESGLHHGALFSDLDGDGLLDLVVVPYPLTMRLPSTFLEADNGQAIEVYRGQADGGLARWAFPPGVERKRWGLAGLAGAFGNYGHSLYVANDFGTNDLWVFSSDGGVREVAEEAGLTDPGNGMSVDLGDADGDGALDVYIANMFSKAGTRVLAAVPKGVRSLDLMQKFARGNTLYVNDGDGGYTERAAALGVNRGLWAFASLFADVDDDGVSELAVTNGYLSHANKRDL